MCGAEFDTQEATTKSQKSATQLKFTWLLEWTRRLPDFWAMIAAPNRKSAEPFFLHRKAM